MSSCNETQQSETTTNWVVEWLNDAAGRKLHFLLVAKINSVTVFGKKYTNDNLLYVRKLKDS